jgi:hypothetical protein
MQSVHPAYDNIYVLGRDGKSQIPTKRYVKSLLDVDRKQTGCGLSVDRKQTGCSLSLPLRRAPNATTTRAV